jgi:hypothetical protein
MQVGLLSFGCIDARGKLRARAIEKRDLAIHDGWRAGAAFMAQTFFIPREDALVEW